VLEWKTAAARYAEEPEGLLALDPQLVCYSWMTGISEVAQVVFVRKREERILSRLLFDETSMYSIHMKRTNLVLDPQLLEEATRVLRVKTYSAAVNTALEEVLRMRRIQRLPEFFGTNLWEGTLREMREDRPNGHGHRKHRSRE
jgi:Arc/MetJ family transcription regulator